MNDSVLLAMLKKKKKKPSSMLLDSILSLIVISLNLNASMLFLMKTISTHGQLLVD